MKNIFQTHNKTSNIRRIKKKLWYLSYTIEKSDYTLKLYGYYIDWDSVWKWRWLKLWRNFAHVNVTDVKYSSWQLSTMESAHSRCFENNLNFVAPEWARAAIEEELKPTRAKSWRSPYASASYVFVRYWQIYYLGFCSIWGRRIMITFRKWLQVNSFLCEIIVFGNKTFLNSCSIN